MPSHPFTSSSLARWFFLLLAAGVTFLFWNILSPFIMTILTAAMVAVLVTPVEKWLRSRVQHPRISTIIVLLGVFLLLVGPLTLIGIVMVRQAVEIAQWLLVNPEYIREFFSGTHPIFGVLPDFVRDAVVLIDVTALLQSIADWAKVHGAEIFSSGTALVFKTFIFFVCLYFFLVDREAIVREMLALSPLRDSVDKSISTRMVATVRGVVFGSLIVAFVQGILAAIGLTIFGVPGALIWSALVILAAQIPMFGTATIMIPAIIYLFATGHVGAGIGLLLWAGCAVGLIDNILQPIIVGGKTRIHALLILLSMLGGLEYFGPIGFIFGPTVLAAFLVILELYKGGFLER